MKSIKVFDSEKNESRQIPLIGDRLLRQALLAHFPGSVSIQYKDGDIMEPVPYDETYTFFTKPDDSLGWNRDFFIVKPVESSRPLTPMLVDATSPPPPSSSSKESQRIVDYWKDRVFKIFGRKAQGSSVLIGGQSILTAAHLSFKLNEYYDIKGMTRSDKVQCVFISQRNDFAVLKGMHLPELPAPFEGLCHGQKYCLMGYPTDTDHSHPAVTMGIMEGFMEDAIHGLGTPGSKRGYSGGPVFNCSGNLTGILVGGIQAISLNTSVQEILNSSAEQKYSKILLISIIIDCSRNSQSDQES